MPAPYTAWAVALLAVVAMIALGRQQQVHLRQVRADRAALFEQCDGLRTTAGRSDDAGGLAFPRATGILAGRHVSVQPVLDTLQARTLPTLWLVLHSPETTLPVPGEVSILARPTGVEFYSRHFELGARLRPGENWPAELSARASAGAADEASDWVHGPAGRSLAHLMTSDRRIKEVVVHPTGLRVVWRCAVADSASYRVTRRVDLEGARVDPDALAEALSRVRAALGCRPAERELTA